MQQIVGTLGKVEGKNGLAGDRFGGFEVGSHEVLDLGDGAFMRQQVFQGDFELRRALGSQGGDDLGADGKSGEVFQEVAHGGDGW